MITGKNAEIYRSLLSNITIEELSHYIAKEIILAVEAEDGKYPSDDIIALYYRAVNTAKKRKVSSGSIPAVTSGSEADALSGTEVETTSGLETETITEPAKPKKSTRKKKSEIENSNESL
jgi:hypothetical protein